MVIKFMEKKERSLIPIIVVFMIVLQLANLLTTGKDFDEQSENVKLIDNNIKTINTQGITYRVNDLKKIDSDFSKDNSIYQTYCIKKSQEKYKNIHCNSLVSEEAINLTLHLPDWFMYKTIDENSLKSYLTSKSSILAEEPYFSSIMEVSQQFNINPILLFAITGQEQSFVPKEHVNAVKIANNPYNVFCSWQSYNTDIVDASEIACRTIINLSKDRPDSVDPLVWVNRKYSADQSWHYGVRSLYNEIDEFINK